ncbi:hypothetical protein [Nocardioides marmoraquaticus]
MTTDDANRYEDAREEDARQRALQIEAAEAAADRAADEVGPTPDAEIADAARSGRQHDYDDSTAYGRSRPGRRRSGPAR